MDTVPPEIFSFILAKIHPSEYINVVAFSCTAHKYMKIIPMYLSIYDIIYSNGQYIESVNSHMYGHFIEKYTQDSIDIRCGRTFSRMKIDNLFGLDEGMIKLTLYSLRLNTKYYIEICDDDIKYYDTSKGHRIPIAEFILLPRAGVELYLIERPDTSAAEYENIYVAALNTIDRLSIMTDVQREYIKRTGCTDLSRKITSSITSWYSYKKRK
jgi:hypothetical protein